MFEPLQVQGNSVEVMLDLILAAGGGGFNGEQLEAFAQEIEHGEFVASSRKSRLSHCEVYVDD